MNSLKTMINWGGGWGWGYKSQWQLFALTTFVTSLGSRINIIEQ